MNKLRILPLAFLLWPAFASAVCSPAQTCVVTSGTVVVEGLFSPAPFNFAGRDFSASGVISDLEDHSQLPFGNVFEPTSNFGAFFGGDIFDGNLQFELSVDGVPLGIPRGAFAGVSFFTTLDIPDGGVAGLTAPFSFQGEFTGAPEPFSPGLGCDVLNCVTLNFRGSGIVTYDVEGTSSPTVFGVQQETFTFRAPEPATLSLFAAGLVALVMRRKAVAALHMS